MGRSKDPPASASQPGEYTHVPPHWGFYIGAGEAEALPTPPFPHFPAVSIAILYNSSLLRSHFYPGMVTHVHTGEAEASDCHKFEANLSHVRA